MYDFLTSIYVYWFWVVYPPTIYTNGIAILFKTTTFTASGDIMTEKQRTDKRYRPIRRNCTNIDDPEFSRRPEDGHGFIYRYHFIKSGKDYIGQTINSVRKRLHGHTCKELKVDEYIRSGAEFTVEILSETKIEFLDDAERYCISKFNTYYPDGLNMTHGGLSFRDFNMTEERRKLASESAKRRWEDLEYRRNMSTKLRKAFSRPEFNIFKDMHREHVKVLQERRKINIVCLETGETYTSIKEASERTGCSRIIIGKVIKGEGLTANGLHFISYSPYVMEDMEGVLSYLKKWEAIVRHMQAYNPSNKERSTSVKCVETGKTYRSISEASKDMSYVKGLSVSKISEILKGKRRTYNGYSFVIQ